jgi:hypothetical protein
MPEESKAYPMPKQKWYNLKYFREFIYIFIANKFPYTDMYTLTLIIH